MGRKEKFLFINFLVYGCGDTFDLIKHFFFSTQWSENLRTRERLPVMACWWLIKWFSTLRNALIGALENVHREFLTIIINYRLYHFISTLLEALECSTLRWSSPQRVGWRSSSRCPMYTDSTRSTHSASGAHVKVHMQKQVCCRWLRFDERTLNRRCCQELKVKAEPVFRLRAAWLWAHVMMRNNGYLEIISGLISKAAVFT